MNEQQVMHMFRYEPDTGRFYRRAIVLGTETFVPVGGRCDGRVRIWVGGKLIQATRLAVLLMTGRWPTGVVDHIDGNALDNRWCNLREVNQSDNMRNISLRKDNASGKTGVHFAEREGKWAARVRLRPGPRGMKHIGYFDTLDEAVTAMKKFEEDNQMVRRS